MEDHVFSDFQTCFTHCIFKSRSSLGRIDEIVPSRDKTDIAGLTFGNNVSGYLVHYGPVIGNDIEKTVDLGSYTDYRRRIRIGKKFIDQLVSHTGMVDRIVADYDSVVIVKIRYMKDALISDDLDGVYARYRTIAVNIHPMPFFPGIGIKIPDDG